jgi:hypothetical protein
MLLLTLWRRGTSLAPAENRNMVIHSLARCYTDCVITGINLPLRLKGKNGQLHHKHLRMSLINKKGMQLCTLYGDYMS